MERTHPDVVWIVDSTLRDGEQRADVAFSDEQRKDLTETINACAKAEGSACVVDANPAPLDRMLKLEVPMARVTYRFKQLDGTPLEERVRKLL